MRRRRGAGRLALLLTAGLLASCGSPPGSDGPRLLLICADTLRADVFLHADINDAFSPWLARGQVFTRAHTTAPWTLPTIASVFTGLYPAQHGAGRLGSPVANLAEQTPTALSGDATTLAETLATAGYRTALFSAHPWLKAGFGLDQGFAHREFLADDSKLVDRMLGWLQDQPDTGVFTYLHLMRAHDLHRTPREELEAILEAVPADTREFLRARATARACQRPHSARCLRNQVYLLSLLQVRAALADLMERLEAAGELANTQVVLFSDHGEAFGEHLREQKRLAPDPRGAGGGHGQYLYQELLHIPLISWRPGVAGGRRDEVTSLVDLYPNLLDWLGVAHRPAHELPGRALGVAFDELSNPRAVYASNIAYGPQSIAIRKGDDKAIYWPEHDRFHFFDLAADPGEQQPLKDAALELEFSTLAGDYLEMNPLFDAGAPELDAEHLKDLQSIGYLQGEEEE